MSKQPFVEVDGVLRPALNSEGRMIHPTPQGVINFWRWFGDSKVVDKQGRPLVVYHGTTVKFDRFRCSSADAQFGPGIYFTDEKSYAEEYGSDEPEKFRLMAVYLRMKSPVTVDRTDELYDMPRAFGPSPLWPSIYTNMKLRGYDGLWLRCVRELVVFSPTQIKSATGNRGTFDPADPVLTNPPRFPAMSYAAAHAWEKQAAARGVSAVARSHRGFMRAYEDAGSFAKLSPWWKRRREGFLARHIAQAMRGENIWERTRSGIVRPTRRSLALIMWGFMPPKKPAGCRPGVWE